MAFEFKNLSEVEVQDKPTENTTVMAFEGGVPKQIPAGEFGSRKALVIDCDDEDTFNWDTLECVVNYDPIYEALESGGTVLVKYPYIGENGKNVESVIFWRLDPGSGLFCDTWNISNIHFTNGSYHTTA